MESTLDFSVVPGPFSEIKRAHAAFEIFELSSARIGSGRPLGPRSQLWGSVVVLARSALEQALRRIHRCICGDLKCEDPQLDPHKFERFLRDHEFEIVDALPLNLHASLRKKDVAKSGEGSGVPANGPLTSESVFELLGALNHIRNGFVHQEPKKTEKLHEHGAGLLWVRPERGSSWTVQKPHAFSTIRFCHTVFRFVILCGWGPNAASDVRVALPLTLEDRLPRTCAVNVEKTLAEFSDAFESEDMAAALEATKLLRSELLRQHFAGEDSNQPTLDDSIDWRPEPLSDPLI